MLTPALLAAFISESLSPTLQHAVNVAGSTAGLISRLQFMLQGGHKRWSFQTITAMHQISLRLTLHSLALLHEF